VSPTPTVTENPASKVIVSPTPENAVPAVMGLFILGSAPQVSITSISPAFGSVSGGDQVTIYGANFSNANQLAVMFDGVTLVSNNISRISSTEIIVRIPPHNAGPVQVTVTNTNGSTSSATIGFTYKANLTVTANPKSKSYGEDNPPLTATVTGLADGDTLSSLGITLSTTATKTSGVGSYDITVSGPPNLNNYIPVYRNSTLTVGKANLTVAADPKSKSYGEDNPPLTATVTGLADGDTLSSLGITLSTMATKMSGAGNYDITASGPPNLNNYIPVYRNGTLTVGKANLTVTANPKSKTYGGDNPELTATVAGLVNGDTLGSLNITLSTDAAKGSGAGSYNIVVNHPEALDNYNPTYTNGTLTVNKANLSVKADNKSKTYGDDNPELTATVAGLVNGDTLGSLNITLSTDAVKGSGAGSYTIVVNHPEALSNYNPTYTNGTLTVNPKALTIRANDTSKTYGGTVTFAGNEFSTEGLVNGNTVTSVTLNSAGAVATAAVGTYDITPSAAIGSGLSNYTITYTAGILTVNPKVLTIRANDVSKTYGGTLTFAGNEFTTDGLVNGNTVTSITLISDGVAATAGVGNYDITPSAAIGSGLSNYNITYVKGKLTIKYGISSVSLPASAQNKNVKIGSTIPLSWKYVNASGTALNISGANPNVSITYNGKSIAGGDTIYITGDAGNSGLRFDGTTNTWMFNWKTTGNDPGDYLIIITMQNAIDSQQITVHLGK
jgi:hypothetical protein